MMTYPWLKQIIKGDKKLLNASEVRICNPPRYDEISVARLYETCLCHCGFMTIVATHITAPIALPTTKGTGSIASFSTFALRVLAAAAAPARVRQGMAR